MSDGPRQETFDVIRVRLPRHLPAVPHGHRDASLDLDVLADRVRRLRPSHRDPEHFHVEKDEIERELRRLARRGG